MNSKKKYEKILSLEIINPCQNTISRFYHDQSFEKLILVEYFVSHGIFFRELSLFDQSIPQTIDDKNVESIVFGKRY